jgi:hypothetical protein
MFDVEVLHIWLDVIGDMLRPRWLEHTSDASTYNLNLRDLDSVWRIFDVTVQHCWIMYGVYVSVI